MVNADKVKMLCLKGINSESLIVLMSLLISIKRANDIEGINKTERLKTDLIKLRFKRLPRYRSQ